jgi:hypothetical protein
MDTLTLSGANITSGIEAAHAGTYCVSNDLLAGGVGAGKLYKLSFTVTLNSGTMPVFLLQNADTGDITLTPSSGVAYSIVFERNKINACSLMISCNVVPTNFSVASITFYEVTPGYVAADTLAPDGWNKMDVDIDVWRQHYDSTYTKDGSFYSIKLAGGASFGSIYWPTNYPTEYCKKMAGRTVTFGAWVWCASASKARLGIRQTSGYTYTTTQHSGGSNWEWLEVTATISSNTTIATFLLDAGTSTTAYFSQPMLVFGSSIGEGNYQPIPNEVIDLQKHVRIADSETFTADATLNTESRSSGMIGKGIKAAFARMSFQNTAAAKYIQLGASSTALVNACGSLMQYTQVANQQIASQGRVGCDSNGDIYLDVEDANCSVIKVDISAIQT